MTNLVNTQALLTGVVVALYAGLIGTLWGVGLKKWLFNRPVDSYFDVGKIAIMVLGPLMGFEWLVRVPVAVMSYPESLFHLTTGWWVQIWIVAYVTGTAAGYSRGRGTRHEPIPIKAGLLVKDDGIILVQPEEHKDDKALD